MWRIIALLILLSTVSGLGTWIYYEGWKAGVRDTQVQIQEAVEEERRRFNDELEKLELEKNQVVLQLEQKEKEHEEILRDLEQAAKDDSDAGYLGDDRVRRLNSIRGR